MLSKRPMRRFLASAWYPLLICLVLAGATAGAFALLAPTDDAVGNAEIAKWARIAGWAVGPFAAIDSLIGIFLLNGIRRLLRIRWIAILHPVVILLVVGSWLVFAWILAGEPPFTPIGRAVVPFVARPLLWGSLAAVVVTLLLSLGLLAPATASPKKK
jgi:hypothetical protein